MWFGGVCIAETRRAFRVLETTHPPVYYFPPTDVRSDCVRPAAGAASSYCEWKGSASYFDVVAAGRTARAVAWAYTRPSESFEPMAGYLAFYAGPMDACLVDGERVVPQPGSFYGGWITKDVVGPFKGDPRYRIV